VARVLATIRRGVRRLLARRGLEPGDEKHDFLVPPHRATYNPHREESLMIRQYVEAALRRARYDKLEDGTFYAEVPRLRGVIATGQTLEECRNQLAEVVEEWVLVRVARGLSIPPLGRIEVKVSKAG